MIITETNFNYFDRRIWNKIAKKDREFIQDNFNNFLIKPLGEILGIYPNNLLTQLCLENFKGQPRRYANIESLLYALILTYHPERQNKKLKQI